MKRLGFGFVIVLIFSVGETLAQKIHLPIHEIWVDTTAFIVMPDTSSQILEDPDGNWTINEVSELPLSDKFHVNKRLVYNINTYWIRCHLRNKMTHNAEIYARTNAPFYEVYFKKQNEAWHQQKTGWLIPWSEKDGMRSLDAIPIVILPGEDLIIYRRIKYDFKINRPETIRAGLQFPGNFLRESYIYSENQILEGFLFAINFGLFLLTSILSYLFYRVTKEKVFITGSVGYFFLSLMFLSSIIFIVFREHPLITHYEWRLLDRSMILVTVFVLRAFLQLKQRLPVLDKILIIASFIPFLDFALRFFTPSIELGPYQEITIIGLLGTCLYLVRHKDQAARIFAIGILPLFIYILGYAFSESLNLSDYQTLRTGVGFLAYLWLVISINRILFYRYKHLEAKLLEEERENEKLAKESEREKRILIEQQKIELEKQVEARTEQLKQSLDSLKSTQSQLIQSEKMASLGELTAGIAHEIQNPLNFVNNFSEVTSELLDEMKTELAAGNQQLASEIANDIKLNLEKINHHGKRAGDIVKGMLQHSRSSSAVKEPTDINKLTDEYLRLAYHGLRAKDKSFSAKFETDLDLSIGTINIVPQDIGRVILNLITNAFYAVTERKNQQSEDYEPTVIVSTKKNGNKIFISVKDNGYGIPQKVIDKIFQPFFTTKPTGQGTGLGLSLSYDIVKAHGGELKVETMEDQGSVFIIVLPTI